jgi:hypothetical protein
MSVQSTEAPAAKALARDQAGVNQSGPGPYEPCDECGAPMDAQQRYCVNCAARRASGANPSSRYFAAMSRKARRAPVRAQQKPGRGSRAAAVSFFALLPIAVAIGVMVGRAGSGEDDSALLEALRHQAAGSTAATGSTSPTASTAAKAGAKKGAKQSTKGGGKVVAKTKYGSVHQVAGFKASEQDEAEGQALVENNVEQTGSNYIEAQTNLPDVTVVGGNPGEAPALPTGTGQP